MRSVAVQPRCLDMRRACLCHCVYTAAAVDGVLRLRPSTLGFERYSTSQAARALADLDEAQWAAQGLLGQWHPLRLQQLNHRFLRHAVAAPCSDPIADTDGALAAGSHPAPVADVQP
jgi:hypothetical protein